MKSFLGILMSHRDESDDQYVERIRKRVQTNKKLALLWPVIACLNLAIFVGIVILFQIVIEPIGGSKDIAPYSRTYLWTGFLIGILLGIWASLALIKTAADIKHWLDARKGFRTERLMLKYYDKINGK